MLCTMKCKQLLSVDNQQPLARSSHSCAVLDDNLYVFGGENLPRVPIDNCLNVYNLKTATWRIIEKGDAPPPTVGHTSFAANSNIYIFGGRCGEMMGEGCYNHIYEFNPQNNLWKKLSTSGDLPDPRSFHAMATIDNNAFLFGGCGEKGRYNDLHTYDTEKARWKMFKSCDEVVPRGGAGLVSVDSCVYVIGGFSGDERSDMHCFNVETEQWSQVKAEGFPATSVFATNSYNGIIYVFGGEIEGCPIGHLGAGKLSNNLLSFDTRDRSQLWLQRAMEGSIPTPRGWMSSSRWTDQLLIHGGNGEDNIRRPELYSIALN